METKLKSIFRAPLLTLALKSAIFGGFLVLLKLGDFGILPILFFLWAAFILSAKSYKNISFLILLATAMAAVWMLDSVLFLLLAILFFVALFYISVGIQELIFVHRPEWNYAKNLLLFYAVFALFFLADKSSLFLAKYALVFLASFFLFRSWFTAINPNFSKRIFLASLILAFLILQFLWGAALLPLGLINSAALMVLIAYILFDFTSQHFQGQLTRQLVLKNTTLFVLLLLVIFGTAKWEIG